MIGLFSNTTNPAFNLATEEYLLRETTEDVVFMYVNKPSIIIGKHQNALAEINFDFVNRKNISVHRRLSGGGTVYHDLNNLNFCFIKSGEKSSLVNFALYSQPIVDALIELGLKAKFGKRHDIQLDNKKISGNASHVFKSRVMHHGTLLFKSDLKILNQALKVNPLLFKDKAVKSVRSEVCNISDYIDSIDFETFKSFIFNYLLKHYNIGQASKLDAIALEWINDKIETKYNTDEWNYSYSPSYTFTRRLKLDNGSRIKIHLEVIKGNIEKCLINSNNTTVEKNLQSTAKNIIGSKHTKNNLELIFNNNKVISDVGISLSDWISLFFS